jgi:hypothetical protein
MRLMFAAGVLAVATQAAAQDQRALPYADILEFYGGQGCTILTRTFDKVALVAAGFEADAAIGFTVDMLVWNLAERQGE